MKYHLRAVMHCSATILDSNLMLLVTDCNSTRNIESALDVTVVQTGRTLSGMHLDNCM